jgi:hypothetical protein
MSDPRFSKSVPIGENRTGLLRAKRSNPNQRRSPLRAWNCLVASLLAMTNESRSGLVGTALRRWRLPLLRKLQKISKSFRQASETFRKPSISFRFPPKITGEKLGLSEAYA